VLFIDIFINVLRTCYAQDRRLEDESRPTRWFWNNDYLWVRGSAVVWSLYG